MSTLPIESNDVKESAPVIDSFTTTDNDSKSEEISETVVKTEEKSEEIASDPWAAMPSIREIMSKDGPTVRAVVFRTNGTMDEIDYNTTPRLNQVRSILNDDPTIIGQWHEIESILVRGINLNESNAELNSHKLRYPFDKASEEGIYGDILVYRVNDVAVPVNLTVNDLKEFFATPIEKCEEGSEIEADEDSQESVDEAEMGAYLDSTLTEMVKRQFVEKWGREPSSDELDSFKSLVLGAFEGTLGGAGLAGVIEEDCDRIEYNEDEESGDDDDDDDDDDEDYDPAEDAGILAEDLAAEFEDVANSTDGEAEKEDDVPESVWRKELAETFDVVRAMGHRDGQKFLSNVAATFEELTGRDPSEDDLRRVMGRVQAELVREAQEETLDDLCGSTMIDDDTPLVMDKEKRDELFAYAQGGISREMALEGRDRFVELTGRMPTRDEFKSLLITLATTRFVEILNLVPDETAEDSDYNPSQPSEQAQLERDERDTKSFEAEMFGDGDSLESPPRGSAPVVPRSTGERKKAVAFYSPLKGSGKKGYGQKPGMSESVLFEKMKARAFARFESKNGRLPNADEQAQLIKFFQNDLLDFDDLSDNENEDGSNGVVKKIQFG